MTSTQQNEAQQAARLLYNAALAGDKEPKTQAQIEALYQARRVLEEFIESAGVLESAEEIPPEAVTAIWYNDVQFQVGQNVHIYDPSKTLVEAKILRFVTQHGLASVANNDFRTSIYFRDLFATNPFGSFK